ncbi:MAG: bifunctional diaminohydroxyphosphoribosylaminopyrimidine deaminase/5-amino-6-(5-phosphoribosylamino)uracil reductase RibD, partial [Gammaproteobacteria bacterium]|nr:bifunctional diaminohydroxyphosphoribosylaminopyrimidine deaminase/5-amino-6-(5-phosphoribosylamino)uracil reductase RibD [Gammaproteobacteria bacterium]
MSRALELARKGQCSTDPNPRVGCVLVKNGHIIGEGWHRVAGGPHAEVFALREAGDESRGATAYVTLEPCCHHGRTPPCSDALIEAGVRRVVVGAEDPDPRVAGRGIAALIDAGIEVRSGVLTAESEALNPGFISRQRRGRPYVRCKMGMTLDGRIATASGESQWITSEAARRDVHRLRARSSAIMTGIGTVIVDDPSLTVRLAPEDLPETLTDPLRIVLDSGLRFPESSRMLTLPGRTLIVHGEAAVRPAHLLAGK